jgi:hypothetical protein
MDRLFALLCWHILSLLHVVKAVAVTGFLIGFFVAGFAASTMATNTTNVTRRIAKNFIVGLDSAGVDDGDVKLWCLWD